MQHGIRSDSVLRAERIAALAPPVACVVVLAEWLAYVDWEGFDSALHAHFDTINALATDRLQLPPLPRDQVSFQMQRPLLVEALLAFIQQQLPLFP